MVANHEDEVTQQQTRTTLFIRNLPFETSNEKLEEEFSNYGPIKKAFVVKDKDNKSRCRGFGYVQFVLQDDANKAISKEKKINGRLLNISYADKKPKHANRKRGLQNDGIDGKDKEGEDVNVNNDESKQLEKDLSSPSKKHKKAKLDTKEDSKKIGNARKTKNPPDIKISSNKETELQRTIVVNGLKEKVKKKAIRTLCEKFGEIENIVYPVPERTETVAFIRYKDIKDAVRASQKIGGQKLKKSNRLSAVLLTKEGKVASKKILQQSRIIIRNLSFKCEEEDLKELFSEYGKIIEIRIPTKLINGIERKIGCAFVQFDNTKSAKLAIDEINLKKIKDRPVVVDWAVSKEKYIEGGRKLESDNKESNSIKGKKDDIPKFSNKKIKKDGSGSDDDNDDGDHDDDGDDDKADEDDDGESNEESIDEESELAKRSDEDEDESDDKNEGKDFSDNNEHSDTDRDSGIEDSEIEGAKGKKKETKQLKDAKEGKTIFLRNLAYETDEDILTEEFEKYGDIVSCKVVRDQHSGHSKGSAFIKFSSKEYADNCVKEIAAAGDSIVIDGRHIKVSLAVTRGKLSEIDRQNTQSKKETDKRNLFLASEGLITKNTPGADLISEADMKRREKALAEKKKKLKDPNYFISTTRLCMRNIPVAIDSNALRKVLNKEIPDNKVQNIKIERAKDRLDATGQPRSMGYGFIECSDHESALRVLRRTNNNPDIFSENRRPIVEFSVESTKALKILELKKNKINRIEKKVDEDPEAAKLKRYKKREKWKKRLERFKQRREDRRKNKETQQSGGSQSGETKNEIEQIGKSKTVKKVKNSKPIDSSNKKIKAEVKVAKPRNEDSSNKANKVKNIEPIDATSKKVKTKLKATEPLNEDSFNKKPKRKSQVNGNSDDIVAKRSRKNKDSDEVKFNKLVQKYKVKILQTEQNQPKRKKVAEANRWFE